jgi:predicted DNA-binding protein
MGRPSLGVQSTVVRLPKGLGERIDALVGPNRRAAFIRKLVEKEVERLEKVREA